MTAQHDPDFDLDVVLAADDGAAAVAEPVRASTPERSQLSRTEERPDRLHRVAGRTRALASAVLRYRWLPIALFLLPVIGAAIVTFTAEPVYEARARVLLEPRARRIVPFRQVNDEAATLNRDMSEPARPGAAPGIAQWGLFQERLRTRGLDERVPRRDLAVRTLDDLQLWDTLAALVPAQGVASGVAVPEANRGPRGRAIRGMLAGMRVAPVPRTRLVDLVFRSSDPALAQSVANALAGSFIALTTDARLQKTRDAALWLDARVDESRQQVLAAEGALQQFRLEHGDVGRGRGSLATRRLLDLNAAATDARMIRIEHEVLHHQLSELGTDGAMGGDFAVLSDTGVRRDQATLQALEKEEATLAAELGDRHPRLIAVRNAIGDAEVRLQTSIELASERVRQEFERARAQERELLAALDREKAGLLASDRAGLRFGLLQSDVQAARRIYTQLLRRRDQVRHAAELSVSNMRVIDPAERPSRPVSPRHERNLLMGLAAGTLLALIAVYGVDALRRDLASPEGVRRRLGLATFGVLPPVGDALSSGPLRPARDEATPFAEAVRALRTQLTFAVPDIGRVIVVTSTEPGEGKSTVAAHLAASLAAQEERVLLIDADMRRPSAHAFFGAHAEPGLSHALRGLESAEACARSTDFDTLMLLPAGAVPPNPSELLLSRRFTDLLSFLAEQVDRVVIDAPPVLAVTDAAVVGHEAAGVLFVIDPGKTNAHRARHAIDELRHVRARVLGVVLNRVSSDGARL